MPSSKIKAASNASIAEAARLLADGQLVGVPTETVYGLAADATNSIAVRKIFQAKGRPANNPLIIHVDSEESARRWVRVDHLEWLAAQWRRAAAFWPGPLTVVVPRSADVVDEVTAGAPTVAVRVPSHPVMRSLLAACEFPIAAPSANPSNYVSPTCAEHVRQGLGDTVAMILDGGECECGLESTIIRLRRDGVELLRPGGLSVEQLQDAFGCVHLPHDDAAKAAGDHSRPTDPVAPMPAPGMLAKHYAPTKPLRTVEAWRPTDIEPSRVARIAFAPLPDDQAGRFGWYRTLSSSGDLNEVAQHLFTAIRQADATGCELIVIDRCERTGIGRAIMDRIDRAAG
ncbi:L-threonylcarbamoyladenylate synthase [Stieleria sp. ICT_E10.1]|uniref:L-threonylcarbamoyladenylate synthase n=1 Tax=Stieleria sedimenti TaxID=2976331 RepID=UPI00217F85D4|nr:L-threonylcarbamoyladenylate synthase [Stieleria sedimenti]MCS7465552.1 L-threonylcarbamoyladenylate synthase [Stieleria sedimenti]